MNKYFLLFIMLMSFAVADCQIAPQKGFTDKLALAQQDAASTWLKAPPVYVGNNYDLTYQRMKWNIDPDTLFISGEVCSYFTTTKPNVTNLSFDLSSVLTVDSVIYHSSAISFTLSSGDSLILDLPAPISLGQSDSVSVFYHGNPPQGSGFGSFRKDIHDTMPIIWTLSEPFGAKEWWPCKNDLSDKIDSIDIYIITPSFYRASSNGILVSETVQGMNNVAHWKHRYPIAAYLVCAAVTNYQSFSVYAHYGSDSIEILNYVYPETYAAAQANVLPVIQSMELYDSLFIPYPFMNERYGHTQFNWAGGMEHQTNTFLIHFQHELMAHELSHQWVGDMITCGNWHDIWLNEGFATYWTGLTYNFLFNGYYWPIWKKNQIDNIVSAPDGSVYCSDTTSVSRIFNGRLSYAKGGMLLHMLRGVIGDSAFFAGMKNYLSDANLAYGYACSDDFITHMEAASDTTLTEFFNDWLYGEGYPIYAINCEYSIVNDDLTVTINQSQSHSSVSYFEMPVPLEFRNAANDTIVVFNNSFYGQQYIIDVGFIPDSVKFDPEMWLVATVDTVLLNITDYESDGTINVFPNPVSDFLNVDFAGTNISSVQIMDVRGMLVKSIEITSSSKSSVIDLSGVAKGVYLLKVTTEENTFLKKIVKL
jgi:aminopeptidase N